jgi:hypothetical protein
VAKLELIRTGKEVLMKVLLISKSYQELIELGAKEANHEKAVPVKDKGIMQTFKASTELASPDELNIDLCASKYSYELDMAFDK